MKCQMYFYLFRNDRKNRRDKLIAFFYSFFGISSAINIS